MCISRNAILLSRLLEIAILLCWRQSLGMSTVEERNHVTVIRVMIKKLNHRTVAEFHHLVKPYIQPYCCLLLELSNVMFIDEYGLDAIQKTVDLVRGKGGNLKLACLEADVRSLIKVISLKKVVEIYPSEEEGLDSFAF